MLDKETIINQTKTWLATVIIGHGLCPFAKREYDNDTIHYAVCEAADLESLLEQIKRHCEALDGDRTRETSLLIMPEGLSDFELYLDMLDIATKHLKELGYEGVYQLASFHPQYRFAGAAVDAASHYTNRSPYPMLHILREASIETVLENYDSPENIPKRNIALTQALGLKVMQDLLAKCYK